MGSKGIRAWKVISGGKAAAEWLKWPNQNNNKTHCNFETPPLKKKEQVRAKFPRIKVSSFLWFGRPWMTLEEMIRQKLDEPRK